MKICSTCKHWSKPQEYTTGYGLGVSECKKIGMFWDATEWSADYEGRRFKAGFEDAKAFAQDGSDYSAYLLTKPDFGCVMHEEGPPG